MAALNAEDKELEATIAKSSRDENERLQAASKDQHDKLAEHVKNKVKISDPSSGESTISS